jgi:hypothetical protein
LPPGSKPPARPSRFVWKPPDWVIGVGFVAMFCLIICTFYYYILVVRPARAVEEYEQRQERLQKSADDALRWLQMQRVRELMDNPPGRAK